MNLEILYEDNHIIVAIKPHMLPSQADSSSDPDMLSLVKEYIKRKYNKPGNVYTGLVHRLDRPTGGVMAFARTSKAASRLFYQIQSGTFKKTYYAVVQNPPPSKGMLEDYLLKNSSDNIVSIVNKDTKGAKYAKLYYSCVQEVNGFYLCKINLITGRSHQIRAQFKNMGCPIFGDVKYGHGEGTHLCLWSYSIEFEHPTTKKALYFSKAPDSYPFNLFNYDI